MEMLVSNKVKCLIINYFQLFFSLFLSEHDIIKLKTKKSFVSQIIPKTLSSISLKLNTNFKIVSL